MRIGLRNLQKENKKKRKTIYILFWIYRLVDTYMYIYVDCGTFIMNTTFCFFF